MTIPMCTQSLAIHACMCIWPRSIGGKRMLRLQNPSSRTASFGFIVVKAFPVDGCAGAQEHYGHFMCWASAHVTTRHDRAVYISLQRAQTVVITAGNLVIVVTLSSGSFPPVWLSDG